MRENSSLEANSVYLYSNNNYFHIMQSAWFIYIIRTTSGTLYTGITTDVERRMEEHASSVKGAKSLRGKGPLKLEFTMPVSDRSEASILEARIKKLTRDDKEKLIAGHKPLLESLTC